MCVYAMASQDTQADGTDDHPPVMYNRQNDTDAMHRGCLKKHDQSAPGFLKVAPLPWDFSDKAGYALYSARAERVTWSLCVWWRMGGKEGRRVEWEGERDNVVTPV